jgi:uncharacterized membrane protein YsdA (DUF1294 family)
VIYVVTNQTSFFSKFPRISIKESLEIIQAWGSIQFDTETLGKDAHVGKLLSAQFGAPDKSIQIVVDCATVDIRNYKEQLESKLVVGQNLKFDLQWLYNYEIIPLRVYDTMIAEQLIYLGYPPAGKPGGISYALNEIAMRYLGKYIDKTIRGQIQWRGLDDDVIEYAANDVVDLVDIAAKQIEICRKRRCMRALQIEMNFVPVIAYLEWCGIKLDVDKWKAKHNSWRIPENTLFMFTILGGGFGTIIGMYTFRHKTKKLYFTIGMPLILILEIVLVVMTIWF